MSQSYDFTQFNQTYIVSLYQTKGNIQYYKMIYYDSPNYINVY